MTSRNHKGVESARNPIRNPVPITYFGSAWAVLGLVRPVSSAHDTSAKQQQAFDSIRGFHGKYDIDEASPGRPVVSVDLRYYEVSDDEVADSARELQAFPQLVTLQFKSMKITDAGLAHLKALPRLRNLALENAAISDAGLDQLKALTALETLNLKGSRITDTGLARLRETRPGVKVER